MDFWCLADIFSNIIKVDILMPGMLMARNVGQVGLVGCKYDWKIWRSDRELILCIPLPIAQDNLSIDLTTLRVREAHQLQLQACFKR